MRRKLAWMVGLAMAIAAATLSACGGGSCLDEYPCNVPADDPDASGFDSGRIVADTSVADTGADASAIVDAFTIDDGVIDASPRDAGGSDAADH